MGNTDKKVRPYRHITPYELSLFTAKVALLGNGTQAVRVLNQGYYAPQDRAFKLARKSKEEGALEFIDKQFQQIGVDAVNRLGDLVNSTNEKTATKNVHYTIDHLKGKALARSESKHLRVNIETVLE